ncbi:MAG: HD domain-containing phosphohydrolase [Bacillota bacterium]
MKECGPEVDLVKTLVSLSRSLDFSHRGLLLHHLRVTLVALRLGREAGLAGRDLLDLFRAAVVHDAGAVTWPEKAALEEFDVRDPWDHCRRGHAFLDGVSLMGSAGRIILSHHDRWAGGNPSGLAGQDIPLAARIIHLADRVDVLLRDGPVLDQREGILRRAREGAGRIFDPHLVGLLEEVAGRPSFWLDLVSPWVAERVLALVPPAVAPVAWDELRALAGVFARVVDAKSRFTYRHSRGVAGVARLLGERLGFSATDGVLLEVAGLLHDLGKLTVPEEILEKPGPLTRTEYNVMMQHPYYTYWLLQPVAAQFPLAAWAAYHHERLDGTGYPFRLPGEKLDLGARVVAVADVFTALREERPYRPGLDWAKSVRLIGEMARTGALDGEVVAALLASRREIDALWAGLTAQSNDRLEEGSSSDRPE